MGDRPSFPAIDGILDRWPHRAPINRREVPPDTDTRRLATPRNTTRVGIPMKILVLERNLMWSSRLARSLRAAGFDPETAGTIPDQTNALMAIINLGERTEAEIQTLKNKGMKILAHAGHKEKDLLTLGEQAGCDRIATNSEMANKLPQIVKEMLGEG